MELSLADISKNATLLKKEVESAGGSLVAVSKKFSTEAIESAFLAGVEDFGENYLSEALQKIEKLKNRNIKWHYVGRLQSGNLSKVIGKFHLIHSVSKISHLQKISNKSVELQKVLIQISHDMDDREGGVKADKLEAFLNEAKELVNIDLSGLMFLPPLAFKNKELEEAFLWVKSLKEHYSKVLCAHSWDTLSMGMSGDYKQALQCGSTHVRLGTLIFGSRD